jgi:hypothetical protein
MSQSETSKKTRQALSRHELRSHPAVRNYMLFCLAALFLLVVCLADRGLEWWCLVPALIGCLTLLTHWSHGPPLVLLSLSGLLGVSSPRAGWYYAGWSHFQTPTLMDLVLCIAVLAYVLGHYRLLSLIRHIFPPDSRRSRDGAPADPSRRRSADLVNSREIALLGFALPVWAGLAVIIWVWMMDYTPPLGIPRELWRVLRFVWAGLAVLAATGIVAGYLRLTTATPEESLLYLQDECWRQTRREQSILNRWLTWARLRAQRKKESL